MRQRTNAGAPARRAPRVDQLRAGDDHNTAAIAATRQGKITEAATHLNQATAAWTTAERDARAAAAPPRVPPRQDACRRPGAAKDRSRSADHAKRAARSPSSPNLPVAQPPPKIVANPSIEIEAVVANYARAIESRDIGELRRAYPGATQGQLDGFGEFFKTLRTIRAHYSVGSLDIRGDAADAKLTGTYDYVTTAGKSEQQSVNVQASFRHDGGVWKLTLVR